MNADKRTAFQRCTTTQCGPLGRMGRLRRQAVLRLPPAVAVVVAASTLAHTAAAQPTTLPMPQEAGAAARGYESTQYGSSSMEAPPLPLGTAPSADGQPYAERPYAEPSVAPYDDPSLGPQPMPQTMPQTMPQPYAGQPYEEQPYLNVPQAAPFTPLGGDHLPPPPPGPALVPVTPSPGLQLPATVPTIDDFSWILIEKPRPKPIRVQDLITITVDDKNEVFVDQRFNRSRIGQIKAELKEFIRLKDGRLENAAANSPTVDANLQSRLNSQGQIQASEGLKSIVTAKVVDIYPNGNLVLEAKKHVQVNRDNWEYRLTGIIRPEKISRDFTALSEDLADLKITKRQNGKVHHSTKRPWGVVLYDWLSPF